MAEQKITITIDENGKIQAKTEGLKGELCLQELQQLLNTDLLQSVQTTDEYLQQAQQTVVKKQEIKK